MNRRDLLRTGFAAIPVGLAGCAGGDGTTPTADTGTRTRSGTRSPPGDTPTDTGTPDPTPSPTRAPAPGTSVRVVDRSLPREAPVDYEIETVHPRPTADRPPLLRTRITNTSDAAVRLGEERRARLSFVDSEDGVLFLHESGGLKVPVREGCWQLRSSPLHADYYGVLELGAAETVVAESAVYGSSELPDDVCLPSGDHRVRPPIFWSREGTPDHADEPVELAFTLRVER